MNSAYEKFTAAVDEYLRRLQFNNLSPLTLRNYGRVLRGFGEYLHEIDDGDDLYAVVEGWRDMMLRNGTKPSTVKQYLVTLKIFFEKAGKRSFPADLRFAENPVDEDFIPRVKKKPYDNLLDDNDIIKLWKNKCPISQMKHTWPRNYAIVCLILATGLRNKEVLDLTLSDVDFLHREITVRSGKGDKFRIVDAPEIVLQSMEQYLRSGLRPSGLSDDDYLFGTNGRNEFGGGDMNTGEWKRGTREWLSHLIVRHVQNVCGNGALQITSHDLRHLYARIHLNVNGNISELQAALGHASPEITQVYAGRIMPHRARASAKAVLAARDEAAEQLRRENEKARAAEQKVIPLFA